MSLDPRARDLALLSLRPRFASAILDGSKSVEIRRRRVHLKAGAVCLLYASSPQRSLVGAARVGGTEAGPPGLLWQRWGHETGLSADEFSAYLSGREEACAILVAGAVAFREPIPLSELRRRRPTFVTPQSYRFLGSPEYGSILNGEAQEIAALTPACIYARRSPTD